MFKMIKRRRLNTHVPAVHMVSRYYGHNPVRRTRYESTIEADYTANGNPYMNAVETSSSAILSGLKAQLDDPQYSDLKISVGAKQFNAHKVVLCPQSSYIRAALGRFAEAQTGQLDWTDLGHDIETSHNGYPKVSAEARALAYISNLRIMALANFLGVDHIFALARSKLHTLYRSHIGFWDPLMAHLWEVIPIFANLVDLNRPEFIAIYEGFLEHVSSLHHRFENGPVSQGLLPGFMTDVPDWPGFYADLIAFEGWRYEQKQMRQKDRITDVREGAGPKRRKRKNEVEALTADRDVAMERAVYKGSGSQEEPVLLDEEGEAEEQVAKVESVIEFQIQVLPVRELHEETVE